MGFLTKAEKKKYVSFELPVEQSVVVPSTQNINKPITQKQMHGRVQEVKKFLSQSFGGFTAERGSGGFYSPKKHKIIQERVAIVTSYATNKTYKKNKPKLLKQLSRWGKKWGQESMGYEVEDDLFFIKPAKNGMRKKKLKRKLRRKK